MIKLFHKTETIIGLVVGRMVMFKNKRYVAKRTFKEWRKRYSLRIEKYDLTTTEEVDEYIIDYIRSTLKEFGSKKYKNQSSLPIRYSTVKLQSGDEAFDLLIKFPGKKIKMGCWKMLFLILPKYKCLKVNLLFLNDLAICIRQNQITNKLISILLVCYGESFTEIKLLKEIGK